MTVNQFSKTSPSLQADSTAISVFHHQHPTSPLSQHHFLTPDLKWAMVIIFMVIVGITMQIIKINGFCSVPKMIQMIIHPNSKLRSSLGLEIAKKYRTKSVNFEAHF